MSKYRKPIGFIHPSSRSEEQEDKPRRGYEKPKDPRVQAFVRAYVPAMDTKTADKNFSLSDIRYKFNVPMPLKGADQLPGVLAEMEDEGFELQVDEMDNMVMPVMRKSSRPQLPAGKEDSDD